MKFKALIALSASLATIGSATALQAQGRAISPRAAQEAAQQHPEIVSEFGGTVNANRAGYVSSVGSRVAVHSGVAPRSYNFTALNSPVLNAFAVPGGYIYITRQLMGLMNDEAELASVLGHEVGHVAANHAGGRQQQSIISQILTVGAAILTGSSQIGQLIGQVSQMHVLKFSRDQEFQAEKDRHSKVRPERPYRRVARAAFPQVQQEVQQGHRRPYDDDRDSAHLDRPDDPVDGDLQRLVHAKGLLHPG